MKLLVISNMYPSEKDPVYGTFVSVFVENISRLNKKGKTDTIVIEGRSNSIVEKLWKYAKFYFSILFTLICHKYDLIYVHTITYPIPPILLISYFKKMPLVFNVHGGDVLTRGAFSEILKRASSRLLKRAKLIVSPSDFFRTVLLREFTFLSDENIFVSPSGGIDKHFFSAPKQKNNNLTIGYVSRIDDGKGWDTFIKAIYILIQRNIQVNAIIAGRGAQTKKMIDMINDMSLGSYIQYIGPIPYPKLPYVYSGFDLFVFPTHLEESLGLVGLEAMASKVPVIGSKIGAVQDYILDNYNGYLFSPNNELELVDKIVTYLSLSDQKRMEMQNNAYQTAVDYESNYINSKLYDKLTSLL